MAVFGLSPRLEQAVVYWAGLPYLRTVLFTLAFIRPRTPLTSSAKAEDPDAGASRFYHRRLWISTRHPEVRALARLEGRRPGCGRFILRGSLRSRLRMTGIQFR